MGEQRADDGDLVWSRVQHAELAVLTKPTCREVHRPDDLVHRLLGRDQRLGPGHDDPKRAAEGAIVRDAEDGGAHFLTCERRSAMASTGQSSTARCAWGSRCAGRGSGLTMG